LTFGDPFLDYGVVPLPVAITTSESCPQREERNFIELMTSDRKLKASREGSKCPHDDFSDSD